MATEEHSTPHFILIPLMSPSHYIPTVDMAKILAQHGVMVTILTTPFNAVRFGSVLDRAIHAGLPISLLVMPFPSADFGLPEGCETFDALPSVSLMRNFFGAANSLQHPFESYLHGVKPFPSCIVSDKFVTWTAKTANKFRIPRVSFDGTSCFAMVCAHFLNVSKVYETVSELEPFVVPGLPDRIEFTRVQLPSSFNPSSMDLSELRDMVRESESDVYGMVVNSFDELEPGYVHECRKVKASNVWCIGPLSLCHKYDSEKAQRGNKSSVDESVCLNWLDSKPHGSVVYACMGSMSRVEPAQMVELGLALEASNRPFVWVVRSGDDKMKETQKWIVESGFEERTKERGLSICGWAPQVLILSHPAVGGFLTHCGWNSTLEGVCAGVPMITWPQFAEQFFNEKLVVQVLGIGASVGATRVVHWGEEEKSGVLVKSEELKNAIEMVMKIEEKTQEMRKRAKELGEAANKAMEEGGSSHLNVTLFIKDVVREAYTRKQANDIVQ